MAVLNINSTEQHDALCNNYKFVSGLAFATGPLVLSIARLANGLVLHPDLLLGLVVVDEVTSPGTHRFERTRNLVHYPNIKSG